MLRPCIPEGGRGTSGVLAAQAGVMHFIGDKSIPRCFSRRRGVGTVLGLCSLELAIVCVRNMFGERENRSVRAPAGEQVSSVGLTEEI